jgi:glycosyltransferase involved in cell wall biosynthesis
MATGVVPLVSARTGAPLHDGVDGFTHEVGNVRSLAEQLRILGKNPELLQRMRAAAMATATTLTWSHAGDRLESLYRDGIRRYHRSGH